MSRVPWRTAANVAAGIACAIAAVWVATGGSTALGLSYVDLGFHELGHLVFSWAPGLVPVLAGSVLQIAVPVGLALYFMVRRESYAAGLLFAWAATSAANVSVYAGDAPTQTLSLLGNGVHDWAWILGSVGHMEWATPLASGIRWFGVALALIGLLVAIVPLMTPHARARAEAKAAAERQAREVALRARAPRHDPRNIPPKSAGRPSPPAASTGRF